MAEHVLILPLRKSIDFFHGAVICSVALDCSGFSAHDLHLNNDCVVWITIKTVDSAAYLDG